MDQRRFDAFLHALSAFANRRTALRGAIGAASAASLKAAHHEAEAKKKKKRKKKKKLTCPQGQEKCGSACCSPDRTCAELLGLCQCKVPCGDVCCPIGQGCLNATNSECGCVNGTTCAQTNCLCSVNAVGGTRLCLEDLNCTPDLQPCASSFDCPQGQVCAVGGCGAVCTPICA
jgi:hypothetical protein